MSKFNRLLQRRFAPKTDPSQKMAALVERANKGDLSSFSGVFRVAPLSVSEKSAIQSILEEYREEGVLDLDEDAGVLSAITSEVKAIANQAVILHGERIKRAQSLLKKYKEGAFTAWLYAAYGNRQTPYNFLQYYEFYMAMPALVHPLIDQMPRQVIYSLASRSGSLRKKEEIVKNFRGESKRILLQKIREEFPLSKEDKRVAEVSQAVLGALKKARDLLKNPLCVLKKSEKQELRDLLVEIQELS